MFCKKCGSKIDNSVKFCPKCGEPVIMNVENTSSLEKAKNNILRHKVSYIAIVVVVAALFIGLKSCNSGNSYTSPIESMISAVETKKFSKLIDAIPNDIIDKIEEESGMDVDKIADAMGDKVFDSLVGEAKSYSVDYKINSEKDLTLTEIDKLKNRIENKMDVKLDISEAKELDITTIVTIDGDKDYDDSTMTVIKIGKKWFINPIDLS